MVPNIKSVNSPFKNNKIYSKSDSYSNNFFIWIWIAINVWTRILVNGLRTDNVVIPKLISLAHYATIKKNWEEISFEGARPEKALKIRPF